MTKDKLVFALYVTVAVATTAHAGVEIYKTFKTMRTDSQIKKAAEEGTLKVETN